MRSLSETWGSLGHVLRVRPGIKSGRMEMGMGSFMGALGVSSQGIEINATS